MVHERHERRSNKIHLKCVHSSCDFVKEFFLGWFVSFVPFVDKASFTNGRIICPNSCKSPIENPDKPKIASPVTIRIANCQMTCTCPRDATVRCFLSSTIPAHKYLIVGNGFGDVFGGWAEPTPGRQTMIFAQASSRSTRSAFFRPPFAPSVDEYA
jgi:hypothetical protein